MCCVIAPANASALGIGYLARSDRLAITASKPVFVLLLHVCCGLNAVALECSVVSVAMELEIQVVICFPHSSLHIHACMQVDVPLDYSLRQYVSVLYKVPRMQVSLYRVHAWFPASSKHLFYSDLCF